VALSIVDNLVKPLMLHGRSNLHPLLALLSVLGGVQVLGPIGILVGPMAVAFLQTLLNMVHIEINSMTKEQASMTPLVD
jgi:predicted PurR-regulated permease PerM